MLSVKPAADSSLMRRVRSDSCPEYCLVNSDVLQISSPGTPVDNDETELIVRNQSASGLNTPIVAPAAVAVAEKDPHTPSSDDTNTTPASMDLDAITAREAQSLFPPEACVFVANLVREIDDDELAQAIKGMFAKYGRCWVLIRRDAGRRDIPFGFVQYQHPDEAQEALRSANGQELLGRPVRVEATRAHRAVYVTRKGHPAPSPAEARALLKGFDITDAWYPTQTEKEDYRLGDGIFVRFRLYGACQEALQKFRDHPEYHLRYSGFSARTTRSLNSHFAQTRNQGPPVPPHTCNPAHGTHNASGQSCCHHCPFRGGHINAKYGGPAAFAPYNMASPGSFFASPYASSSAFDPHQHLQMTPQQPMQNQAFAFQFAPQLSPNYATNMASVPPYAYTPYTPTRGGVRQYQGMPVSPGPAYPYNGANYWNQCNMTPPNFAGRHPYIPYQMNGNVVNGPIQPYAYGGEAKVIHPPPGLANAEAPHATVSVAVMNQPITPPRPGYEAAVQSPVVGELVPANPHGAGNELVNGLSSNGKPTADNGATLAMPAQDHDAPAQEHGAKP